MQKICSFPSKIYGLCRRPFASQDQIPLMIYLFVSGMILFLLLKNLLPWFGALFIAILGAGLSSSIFLRVRLTKKQYQPVEMAIYASDNSFLVSIPSMDMGGTKCQRDSVARLDSLTAFEYSSSLHCIRIAAGFDTTIKRLGKSSPPFSARIDACFFYLEPEDEMQVLQQLETLFGQTAYRMDS